MHILAINDDGPPSQQSSPYIHAFVLALQAAGHTTSVILPHQQRSWISKAHLVGQITKPTYFRPGSPHADDGTTHVRPASKDEDIEEWVLIDGTPASCAQLGLFHFFQSRGAVDLVVSGPNYGRNATALFNLSSGTIGGAMEAAVCGKKAIALSFAFESRDHVPELITGASKHAVRVIEHLFHNWAGDVDLYNINVPLVENIGQRKVIYTNCLANHWTMGSSFEAVETDDEEKVDPDLQEREIRKGQSTTGTSVKKHISHDHKYFKWAPKFEDVKKSVAESAPGNDGWAILQGYTSVTPLQANFMHSSNIQLGELKLRTEQGHENLAQEIPLFHATIKYEDSYVQPIILSAFRRHFRSTPHRLHNPSFTCPPCGEPWLQICPYESLDFENVLANPSSTLANSYIIRKALIRKHYLAHTVSTWLSKHPDSVLRNHVKPTYGFEVDYAEFLEDALVEAYELKESLRDNQTKSPADREWWILKPGMSDRGQGIRVFDSMSELQSIFDEWDPQDEEEEDHDEVARILGTEDRDTIMTSQLRHFVVQPYIDQPLLLPAFQDRKFHIRTYVLAVGSLQVFVYDRMLALCSSKRYSTPGTKPNLDLEEHLTNTCLQPGSNEAMADVVHVVDSAFFGFDDDEPPRKPSILDQISQVTSAIFEAAARGQRIHYQTLPNAFEVFGVDFLIDNDRKVWLLEINAFPDFAQSGNEEGREVVEGFWQEVIKVAVGGWVNSIHRKSLRGRPVDNKQNAEDQTLNQSKYNGGLRKVLDIDLGIS